MIKTTVARRYAQALFELLDHSTLEATRGTLTGLSQAMKESAQLRHVVASPAFGVEDKIAVLTALSEQAGVSSVRPSVFGSVGEEESGGLSAGNRRRIRQVGRSIETDAAGDGFLRDGSSTGGARSNQDAPTRHAEARSGCDISDRCRSPRRLADSHRQHGGRQHRPRSLDELAHSAITRVIKGAR